MKDILSFVVVGTNATIDNTAKTINVTVPFGAAITNLTPTIIINGVSVSPASGVVQDFTNPVTYTVTAADASTQAYVVTVSVAPNPVAPAPPRKNNLLKEPKTWIAAVVGLLVIYFTVFNPTGSSVKKEADTVEIKAFTTEGNQEITINEGEKIIIRADKKFWFSGDKELEITNSNDSTFTIEAYTYPKMKGRAWRRFIVKGKQNNTTIQLSTRSKTETKLEESEETNDDSTKVGV